MPPENSPKTDRGDAEVRRVGPLGRTMLISRILGLFRDILLTTLLGASATADALRAALRIPVILRDMLSEGALSASFSPAYREQQQSADSTASHQFARAAMGSITLLSLTLLTVLAWQADWIIGTVFPGLENRDQAVRGLRSLLPYLALVPFFAVFRGLLHCHRQDSQALRPQIFQNLTLLASGSIMLVMGVSDLERAQGWIWAFLGGALLGALGMLRDVSRHAPIPWPTLRWKVPGHGRFLLDFGALLLSQILIQSYSLLAFHLASGLQTGSLTCLETAFRFHFFPIALIGVSSGIVAADESADLLSRGQRGQLSRMLTRNQRLTAFVGGLAGAGLLATAGLVIQSFFVWGEFTPADGLKTAEILSWYCLAIPFAALNVGLQRTAITLGLRKAVLGITLLGLILQTVILFGGFFEVGTDLIAQSYVISAIFTWLALQGLIRRSLTLPRLRWSQGLKLTLLILVVHQGAHHWIQGLTDWTPGFPGRAYLILGTAILLGVLIATGVGRWLKVAEVDSMWVVIRAAAGRTLQNRN
ncbi:MAG: murein biosynthesis integral membrane protein MurJ [Planctomycetota bacterium]